MIPALAGAIAGVPAGIGLIAAVGHGGTLSIPGVGSLLVVVVATVIGVAGLAAIPARISARQSVAEILASETA